MKTLRQSALDKLKLGITTTEEVVRNSLQVIIRNRSRYMSISFHQLLKVVVENGSSDLHITAGSPPMLRIDGKLGPRKAPAT